MNGVPVVAVMTPGFGSRSFDRELAVSALELILDEQVPPYEGRRRSQISQPLWFESASEMVAAGLDYFGPVARRSVRPLAGFSKADVAETTNVVWIDLDPRPGLAGGEEVFVAEAERNLEALGALYLTPSVVVFSGRGSWAYWKLDRPLSQGDAEMLMKRLYAQFRRDGSEHDIGRIARIPGSINEKTGLQAFVMGTTGTRWDPDDLAALLPELAEPDHGSPAVDTDREPVGHLLAIDIDLEPGGRLPTIDLPEELTRYLDQRPGKQERARLGIDGSALEQAIICHLVNKGCSDSQIALFFDHHQLPRHEEEKQGRREVYAWLARSIAKARARLSSQDSASPDASSGVDLSLPPLVSIGNGTYFDPETQPVPERPREQGWEYRRWTILTEMVDGLKKLELIDWTRERFAIGRSQARRDLDWLEREGYIAPVADPKDRRTRRVYRTEHGRERLIRRPRNGVLKWSFFNSTPPPIDFRKGLATQTNTATDNAQLAAAEPDVSDDPDPDPELDPPQEQPIRLATNEPGEAWGRSEERRRQRSLINDVYRIHIPGNRWTYLQLLLPLDEWVQVRLHEQLPIGTDANGVLVYRSFISPQDPALGGEDAEDPIARRTLQSGGWPARDRMIGWAAELSPEEGGSFRLAIRTEDGVERSNVGVVVQSETNFYSLLCKSLASWDGIVAVRKRGSGKETRYTFERIAGAAVDIPADYTDFDALLAELADPVRMQTVLESLPPYWHFSRRSLWAR